MWQGAGQLNGMCVRAGKKGKNPAIGESVGSFVPLWRSIMFSHSLSFADSVNTLGEKRQLSIEVRAVWPAGSVADLNGTVVSVGSLGLNETVGGDVSTS